MTPISTVPLNTLSGASRVHTLRYQGYPIRAMRCPQGIVWFVLADVIRPLHLRNTSTIRKRLKDPSMVALMNVWVPNRVNPQDSGYRDVQAVNPAGLAALLGVSKYAETRTLLAWLLASMGSIPGVTGGSHDV